jgi:septum formation protein
MVNLKNQPLILASSSIYRRDLLARLGLPFEAISPEADECALPNEGVAAMALRLAVAKATAIAKDRPNAWVIGSDQAADLHGEAIGKPGNFDNALLQLQRMRGQTVHFHTAVCLMRADYSVAMNVITEVRFRDLPDTTLIDYLNLEQPYDCAGSAKCEGMGIALLESIRSDDPTALIGLPLITVSAILRDAGFEIPPSRNDLR